MPHLISLHLGVALQTNTTKVGREDGVVVGPRSFRSLPEDARKDPELLLNVELAGWCCTAVCAGCIAAQTGSSQDQSEVSRARTETAMRADEELEGRVAKADGTRNMRLDEIKKRKITLNEEVDTGAVGRVWYFILFCVWCCISCARQHVVAPFFKPKVWEWPFSTRRPPDIRVGFDVSVAAIVKRLNHWTCL